MKKIPQWFIDWFENQIVPGTFGWDKETAISVAWKAYRKAKRQFK